MESISARNDSAVSKKEVGEKKHCHDYITKKKSSEGCFCLFVFEGAGGWAFLFVIVIVGFVVLILKSM